MNKTRLTVFFCVMFSALNVFAQNLIEYKVVEGDTLWEISGRLTGKKMNYEKIAAYNKLSNADRIYPKQIIKIDLNELKSSDNIVNNSPAPIKTTVKTAASVVNTAVRTAASPAAVKTAVKNTPVPEAPPAADISFTEEFNGVKLHPALVWSDNKKDCSYEIKDGLLYIQARGDGHDIFMDSNTDAPKMLADITGDFTIETKMNFTAKNNGNGAGIVIWQDNHNFLRIDRVLHFQTRNVINVSGAAGGKWFYSEEIPYTLELSYLKMQRIGNLFTASCSVDGNIWFNFTPVEFPVSSSVKAGLFVLNQWNNGNSEASFEYLKITK
ncbi:MAG: LysM domain/BON superfamily protein [Candidatus Aerophobetes bacterium ADurb.Bin490]|nr:MAG: LysM domain/BON superfamily protein [Candidatus Aerophobetes bacterium ADurb.Bin490]HPN64641.1 LysM peptidoglycan-binding domain-containing protein [Candidatus Goldiibacteriota bacterium]HRQ43706.1 LysM peptidoglycan-binding domain-containing protein [Candidatus Goldiibacteriota bacterium]